MKRQVKTAADVMKKKVLTVRPDILVRELAQLFDENGISGAPVVNTRNELIGVVSKSDLVRFQRTEEFEPDDSAYYRQTDVGYVPKGYHMQIPDRTRVEDIMTPAIIKAKSDATVTALARTMRRRHIHRIFITEGKRLRGVVTTMDLLKLLASGN
jgi:CBS domain-containing protein